MNSDKELIGDLKEKTIDSLSEFFHFMEDGEGQYILRIRSVCRKDKSSTIAKEYLSKHRSLLSKGEITNLNFDVKVGDLLFFPTASYYLVKSMDECILDFESAYGSGWYRKDRLAALIEFFVKRDKSEDVTRCWFVAGVDELRWSCSEEVEIQPTT